MTSTPASEKSDRAFRTISEAATTIGVPQHVLRFWETRFAQLQPLKRGGNRRYYRPDDMALLETIRAMLHDEGLTIRGAQLALAGGRERAVPAGAVPAPPPTSDAVLPSGDDSAPPVAVATLAAAPIAEPAIPDPALAFDLPRLIAIRDQLRRALAA